MGESAPLTPRMIASLEEDIAIVNYLEGRKTILMGLGVAQVSACGLMVILSAIAVPTFIVVAGEPIVCGSFLITMAMRPTKWLAVVNLVLGTLSTLACFYGFIIACILLANGIYIGIGVVFLLFNMALVGSFCMSTIYTGIALSCCICCRRVPVMELAVPVTTTYAGGQVIYNNGPGMQPTNLATVHTQDGILPPITPATQMFAVNA